MCSTLFGRYCVESMVDAPEVENLNREVRLTCAGLGINLNGYDDRRTLRSRIKGRTSTSPKDTGYMCFSINSRAMYRWAS